ncbi:MAG: transglutaminase domain-containing protein [Planctomycetaceae bacterium]
MHRQAWIAWLLILLQAGMFWYFAETILFPVVVLAISLPAVWWRRRWELSGGYLPAIDLVVVGFCGMKWYLAPYDPPNVNGFVMYSLMHAAAQFFLLVQVTRLWARRPDRPLPVYLPLLAVLVFICLGDVGLSRYGRMRRMYQNGTLALVGLSCFYYSVARRRQEPPSQHARWVRPVLSVGVLLTCAVTARASNTWLLSRWSELEQLLNRAAGPRALADRRNLYVGFSGQAPLGSVQLLRSALSDEIALRVVSDQAPGYLRGAVFDRYTPTGWDLQGDWLPTIHTRKPMPSGDQLVHVSQASSTQQPQFLLRPKLDSDMRPVAIWRTTSVDRFSFLPLETSRLETSSELLYFDRHSVVSTDNLPPGGSFVAWVPEKSESNSSEPIVQPIDWVTGQSLELPQPEAINANARLRKLPDRVDPRVTELAARLFADCRTPLEKIAAVKQLFATYQYGLNIQVPPGHDPVSYFLLEKPAAHCEFFASGTAVLLRMGDIPCRYVTGYAGAEYNPIGKYWVVRQREAHAWVEAHLPGQGWVVVDATPEDAIPGTVESFGLWQLWDELNLRGQMIRMALANENWAGKLFAVKLFLMALVTTIPGLILTGGVLFLIVRQVRFGRRAVVVLRSEPALIELRRLLEELDRRLTRLDLERAAHETLHQFSERLHLAAVRSPNLREAAVWYQHYAAARYGMSSSPDDQESLRAELQTVCSRLSSRGPLTSGR